jgi:hypothetical protein
VLIGLFIARAWSASNARSARVWEEQERKQAEHDRREVERARDHVAVTAPPTPFDVQTSVEQLWEKLNQPKIDLHSVDGGSAIKIVSGPTAVEMTSAVPAVSSPSASAEPATSRTAAESLARSAAELGRVIAQVSTIAQQVSDTSRVVARTLAAAEQSTDKSTATSAPAEKSPVAAAAQASTASAQPLAVEETRPRTNESAELNEKIGGEAAINKPRPAWVDEPQKQVGNVLRHTIIAGPYATPDECYTKTDELLRVATANYVMHDIGGLSALTPDESSTSRQQKLSAYVSRGVLEKMGIDLAYIRREIAKDQFMETVSQSVGPMKNLYTLLEFSPDVDRELRVRWNELRRVDRLAVIGVLSGLVLGVIGLAFGLLKIDTATKGYYSKRLFLGVPAAIVAAVVCLGMLIGMRL